MFQLVAVVKCRPEVNGLTGRMAAAGIGGLSSMPRRRARRGALSMALAGRPMRSKCQQSGRCDDGQGKGRDEPENATGSAEQLTCVQGGNLY